MALTGNLDTTWTHKDGVFWPESLEDDIPGASVMTFGMTFGMTYRMTFGMNADVLKFWGCQVATLYEVTETP